MTSFIAACGSGPAASFTPAAPPPGSAALPRPFPQPDPSPQSPSSVTSLVRVLACKVAAPPFVPRRVIGQKRMDQSWPRPPRCEIRDLRIERKLSALQNLDRLDEAAIDD